jgi:hypothetical protein
VLVPVLVLGRGPARVLRWRLNCYVWAIADMVSVAQRTSGRGENLEVVRTFEEVGQVGDRGVTE